MLLGMRPEIVCTGDSCPSIDFQVQYNMPPNMIEEKLKAFPESLYYIKADTTTTYAIDLPDDIVSLSMEYTQLTANMPKHFSAENPLPVMISYPDAFLQTEGGTTVVERTVYVSEDKKTRAKPKNSQKMTEAEKAEMRKKDPYLTAMEDYASDPAHYKALKRVGFIPYNQDDELDEFLLAVRDPELELTPENIKPALPALKKYSQCNTIPV